MPESDSVAVSAADDAPEVLRASSDPHSAHHSAPHSAHRAFHFNVRSFRIHPNSPNSPNSDNPYSETFSDELRQRSRSILLPLIWVLLFIYLGGFFSTLLAVIFGTLAAVEWKRLILPRPQNGEIPLWFISGMDGMQQSPATSGGFWLGLGLFLTPIFATSGIILAVVWLVFTLAIAFILEQRWRTPRAQTSRLILFVFGGAAIGLALISWVSLRGLDNGRSILFWIFLVVWAYDSAAWFVGKRIGGVKLMPRISPAKTWSGAIGGLLTALIVGILSALWFFDNVSVREAIIFTLFTSLIAQIGDLAESGAKRYAGVKDSGSMFPGHGGLLDRVDSLVFALVFWLLLMWSDASPSWMF